MCSAPVIQVQQRSASFLGLDLQWGNRVSRRPWRLSEGQWLLNLLYPVIKIPPVVMASIDEPALSSGAKRSPRRKLPIGTRANQWGRVWRGYALRGNGDVSLTQIWRTKARSTPTIARATN